MSLQDKIKSIPLMKPEDIEIRIGQIDRNGKWLTLLLYKNARVDMAILDEVFGEFGWQRTHKEIKGNLFCTISVWDDEKKQWISKEDVGTESNIEAEKGEASSSLKRCGTNWKIGRELYSSPKIFLKPPAVEIKQEGNKYVCYDHFVVTDIAYTDDRKIKKLVIAKEQYNKRTTVFEWESFANSQPRVNTTEKPSGSTAQKVNTPTPQEEKEKKDLLYSMDFNIIKLANMREKDPDFIVEQLRKKVGFSGELKDLTLDGLYKVNQVLTNWLQLAEGKNDETTSED